MSSPWTQVAVFTVLQLPHPSPEQPYIKGLLDPCTNSMTAPNIPAEKLYDKKVSHRREGNSALHLILTLNRCAPKLAFPVHASINIKHLSWGNQAWPTIFRSGALHGVKFWADTAQCSVCCRPMVC